MFGMVARDWWMFLVRGIAAVTFGVLAFVWPGATLSVLVILFGAYALVDGIALLGSLASGNPIARHNKWAVAIMGVIGIAAGIVTFISPGITALSLLYVVAAWAITTGAVQIYAAMSLRHEISGSFWMVLAGAASVVFGVILVASPADGLISLVWLVGLWSVAFGVLNLATAFELRGINKELERAASAI